MCFYLPWWLLGCVHHLFCLQALPFVGTIPGGLKQDMAVFVQGTVPAEAQRYAPKFPLITMEKTSSGTNTVRKACKVKFRAFFFYEIHKYLSTYDTHSWRWFVFLQRFEINFKTGPSDKDDIAFHYNPRMGQYTALNCLRNGSWEKQENAPDKPFTRGEDFQIFFAITSDGYEVCFFIICRKMLEIRESCNTINFTWFLQVYVNGLKHSTFKHRIPLEKVSTLNINGNVSILICGFIQVSKRGCHINALVEGWWFL